MSHAHIEQSSFARQSALEDSTLDAMTTHQPEHTSSLGAARQIDHAVCRMPRLTLITQHNTHTHCLLSTTDTTLAFRKGRCEYHARQRHGTFA